MFNSILGFSRTRKARKRGSFLLGNFVVGNLGAVRLEKPHVLGIPVKVDVPENNCICVLGVQFACKPGASC